MLLPDKPPRLCVHLTGPRAVGRPPISTPARPRPAAPPGPGGRDAGQSGPASRGRRGRPRTDQTGRADRPGVRAPGEEPGGPASRGLRQPHSQTNAAEDRPPAVATLATPPRGAGRPGAMRGEALAAEPGCCPQGGEAALPRQSGGRARRASQLLSLAIDLPVASKNVAFELSGNVPTAGMRDESECEPSLIRPHLLIHIMLIRSAIFPVTEQIRVTGMQTGSEARA